jgi:hypothetical protein
MAHTLPPCEVIPYARFLEFQDRRRRIAAHVVELERPAPIDVSAVPAAAVAVRPQTPNGSQC